MYTKLFVTKRVNIWGRFRHGGYPVSMGGGHKRGRKRMVPSGERRECYRVADLRIDAGAGLVLRNGEEIDLPPLSFDLLLQLVRNAPRAVGREELLETVWRGAVVEPHTLKQRVKLLRQSLGDDPRRPRYIATVRGRGYRLVPRPVSIVTDWSYRLTRRLLHILEFAGRASGGAAILTTLAVLALGAADRDEERQEMAEARTRSYVGNVRILSPGEDVVLALPAPSRSRI